MILSGDIGGTKTNLALFQLEGDSLIPVVLKSYPSQEYQSLNDVIKVMLREHPAEISAAAFGIAGPIVGGRSKLTNLAWIVDAHSIALQLRLNKVGLLNDLAATAYGTLRLKDSDRVVLQSGTVVQHAAIAVIAAGTGLGEGGLLWDGRRYRAIPSEGGHSDFGPRNELEIEVLRFLLTKYARVSYERLVSGPGLHNLYQFFRWKTGIPEPQWLKDKIASDDPSATISLVALDGSDEVAAQALDLFVSLYGAEAGNLALKFLSTGGVLIGGGIAPKILSKIQQGSFVDSFVNKGRYKDLLSNMSISVVLNDKTALYGAAHFAAVMND